MRRAVAMRVHRNYHLSASFRTQLLHSLNREQKPKPNESQKVQMCAEKRVSGSAWLPRAARAQVWRRVAMV
jgi:hypothetical protein